MMLDDDRDALATTLGAGLTEAAEGLTPAPLMLTSHLYGDAETTRIFSPRRTIEAWLEAEVALAEAQAALGVLSSDEAGAIRRAARLEELDTQRLWEQTRNVGYPILPLVRLLNEALPAEYQGRVHFGATTQDIMDTGLVLQLREFSGRLDDLLAELQRSLAILVQQHRMTPIAARTHGQQAVPTTLGAKLATHLSEMMRHRVRLHEACADVLVVSLFGAGGTSAALGSEADEVREQMARLLNLGQRSVPWHASRDSLGSLATILAGIASSAIRLAREIVTLSMTEIGELSETGGHHRGASSTMPQKANPISSEVVIGIGIVCQALSGAMHRVMEAPHERAAGEWQAEWIILPQLCCHTASVVRELCEAVRGLQVDAERATENLELDSGLILAEGYMIHLAIELGRERAHDLVYSAVQRVRRDGGDLQSAISLEAGELGLSLTSPPPTLAPVDYLGSAPAIADQCFQAWQEHQHEMESRE